MKHLLAILLSASLLVTVGCREDEGDLKPSTLTLNTTELSVAAEGGQVEVSYRLEEPVYDGTISVDGVPEWISGIDTSLSGKVTFTVAANDRTEPRSAALSIRYSGDRQSTTLNVTQEAKVIPAVFDIQLELVTQTSAKYSVIPGDKEQTYLSMLVEKDYFDSYDSDEAYFQDDLNYISQMAESFGVSTEEYLVRP